MSDTEADKTGHSAHLSLALLPLLGLCVWGLGFLPRQSGQNKQDYRFKVMLEVFYLYLPFNTLDIKPMFE